MRSGAIDATVVAVSNKATAAGGGAGLLAFVANYNILGILGFLIALVGLIVSCYFSAKKDRREAAEHELRKQEYNLRISQLNSDCKAAKGVNDEAA